MSEFAPAEGHTDEVLYAVQQRLGRVRLNRPRAINALNQAMVDSMLAQLGSWAEDPRIEAVVIDGAGDRGLCAGGDVRSLREALVAGERHTPLRFWESEYALNALIADYPKPYGAWMDRVVMGGGLGISAHGSHRWVTERATVAMPETIIGFFPDVGGLWFLAHAPGEIGTHAALTGLPMTGADAVAMGLADRLIDSGDRESVIAEFAASGQVLVGDASPESPLVAQRSWIDECYAGDDAAAILARLGAHGDPRAGEAAETIAKRSPHSVAITLEALRRARHLSVREVLAQDRVLGGAFVTQPDFAEGVRALLVDKDQAPRWEHASVADVPREQVLAAFGE